MKNKECYIDVNWKYLLISLAIFIVIMLLVLYMPGIRGFDSELLKSIRKFLGQFPSYIPVVVSEFGRANSMLWPQITAGCVLVSHRYYLKAFLVIFFTQASFVVNAFVKDFVCRERPFGGCEGFSFPSTHATTTMCFYGIVCYLILRHVHSEFWRYFLAGAAIIFIILCGLSRLWLGVHFPTDVVAGLFLGFIFVNLYIIVEKFFNA